MDLQIEGRTAVVTGASRGIGAATVALLEAEGARVVGVSRAAGIDVTDPARAERIAELAGGPVDILVNNAGTSYAKALDELTDEDWNAQWELHVLASMRLMRAFAPGMAERGWGRIVNVASSAGKRPSLTNAAYSVTKAAQLSLSRVFADTYAARGVLVNAVAPGAVASGLWMDEGGLADQTAAAGGHHARGGDRGPGGQGAARALRDRGGDRLRRRLPVLRARVDGHRRRLVGRRRHRRHDRLAARAGRSRRSGSRPRPRRSACRVGLQPASTKRERFAEPRTVNASWRSGQAESGVTSTRSPEMSAPACSGARPTGSPDQQSCGGDRRARVTRKRPEKRATSRESSEPSATLAPLTAPSAICAGPAAPARSSRAPTAPGASWVPPIVAGRDLDGRHRAVAQLRRGHAAVGQRALADRARRRALQRLDRLAREVLRLERAVLDLLGADQPGGLGGAADGDEQREQRDDERGGGPAFEDGGQRRGLQGVVPP